MIINCSIQYVFSCKLLVFRCEWRGWLYEYIHYRCVRISCNLKGLLSKIKASFLPTSTPSWSIYVSIDLRVSSTIVEKKKSSFPSDFVAYTDCRWQILAPSPQFSSFLTGRLNVQENVRIMQNKYMIACKLTQIAFVWLAFLWPKST